MNIIDNWFILASKRVRFSGTYHQEVGNTKTNNEAPICDQVNGKMRHKSKNRKNIQHSLTEDKEISILEQQQNKSISGSRKG